MVLMEGEHMKKTIHLLKETIFTCEKRLKWFRIHLNGQSSLKKMGWGDYFLSKRS